jgi:hypothetical protein
MSGRTPRNKTPTSKGKAYSAARLSVKNKAVMRSKNKSDMEDLIKGIDSTTDLGRPVEGAMAETAMGMERSLPLGPVIQPATFVYPSAVAAPPPPDETMDSLTSAMGKTTMGGKYRRKHSRRRRKHRRRTHRR